MLKRLNNSKESKGKQGSDESLLSPKESFSCSESNITPCSLWLQIHLNELSNLENFLDDLEYEKVNRYSVFALILGLANFLIQVYTILLASIQIYQNYTQLQILAENIVLGIIIGTALWGIMNSGFAIIISAGSTPTFALSMREYLLFSAVTLGLIGCSICTFSFTSSYLAPPSLQFHYMYFGIVELLSTLLQIGAALVPRHVWATHPDLPHHPYAPLVPREYNTAV